jgi:hypothetical protein
MPSEKTEQTWKGPEYGNKFAIDQAILKPFGSTRVQIYSGTSPKTKLLKIVIARMISPLCISKHENLSVRLQQLCAH